MVRLLVCGSRDWRDRRSMFGWLDEIAAVFKIECVIDGGQRGADTLGHAWARARGHNWERYFAQWKEEGDGAGFSRNRRMLREGRPTLVVAFPLPQSRGTWHMVRIAREAGVTTWVWPKDRHAITALGEGVFV